MYVANRIHRILVVTLYIVLAAAALIGATVWTTVELAPVMSPVAKTPSSAPMIAGTRTGEFEDGVPVYRLPTITVIADRSVAISCETRRTEGPASAC